MSSSSGQKACSSKSKPLNQKLNFTYALFLHREELRKSQVSSMRAACTKLLLTQELITKTVKNINKCSRDDLQILSRETIFKKNLHREIARQRHQRYLQRLRMQDQQRRQKSLVNKCQGKQETLESNHDILASKDQSIPMDSKDFHI